MAGQHCLLVWVIVIRLDTDTKGVWNVVYKLFNMTVDTQQQSY